MRAAIAQIDTCPSFARSRGDYRLRLIVADGSLQYMESVLAVLELHAIVDLIGRAANFEEIIEIVVNHQPDVVLVDLDMPLESLIFRWSFISKTVLLVLASLNEADR